MTNTDLIKEADELCEGATPGPWKRHDTSDYAEIHDSHTWGKSLPPLALVGHADNAAFIARSRSLVPALADALKSANAEIARLTEAERWIPVSERLPEERGYYLAVVHRTAPDELGGNETRIRIMQWMGEDWRYAYHVPEWINREITDTVTHWMPLPEPPESRRGDT